MSYIDHNSFRGPISMSFAYNGVQPELRDLLVRKVPTLLLNESWRPMDKCQLGISDVRSAEAKLNKFAPLLEKLFPELRSCAGIIESPLHRAEGLQSALGYSLDTHGQLFVKCDHSLPVAGSIKARGGIYEVLLHAERVALEHGLIASQDELAQLAAPEARKRFSDHVIAVGSTGNLGLSIGLTAAALGFQSVIHMSADAREWKKLRLRSCGAQVIEHKGDVGAAIALGREQAKRDPRAYFVDDENSEDLFLGYSAASLRLARQLSEHGVRVDSDHPLFVYLPCGVGGAPGGITFGLRNLFGESVHCFFAEPTASPAMLIRLANADDAPISVRDIGLDNKTEADGLAVATASELVVRYTRSLIAGVFTVRDEDLFEGLYVIEQAEGLRIEPSAAAGFSGPRLICDSDAGHDYLSRHNLSTKLADSTHILWTTGGAFVPHTEYREFHKRGEAEFARKRAQSERSD
jgi:D-serine dehydratase